MRNFFEGVKAKKHPPLEEKVDPVKAKRTLAALTKPPKSLPKGNYEHIIGKEFAEAERSGSIVSDQRLKERRAGKQIAQLGEQAKQSCPPLKVPSYNVANDPRMVPGYSNLGDYLPDDVHYEPMEENIGFINTYLIDATQVKFHAADTEANLLRSLVINENKDIILFPYNFR